MKRIDHFFSTACWFFNRKSAFSLRRAAVLGLVEEVGPDAELPPSHPARKQVNVPEKIRK
jgi:hypothetical protein